MKLVWYCANPRCRKVLKVEPRGAIPKGCKCKVPRLPRIATIVSRAS